MLHNKFKDAVCQIKEVSKDELYIGEKFTCTDVVPGEKSNNGGEYGFYTTYYPTTKPGIYEVISSCTCDFDKCGTGFEGYIVITKNLFNHLISESERIIEEGSLY